MIHHNAWNRSSVVLCENKMVAHTGSMGKRVQNISSIQTKITCNRVATNITCLFLFFVFLSVLIHLKYLNIQLIVLLFWS